MAARRAANGRFKKMTRRRTRANTSSPRRRRNKYKGALNVKQLGLGYASAAVLLGTVFNAPDPIGFVLGKHSGGYGGGGLIGSSSGAYSGVESISLRELFEFDKWKGDSSQTLMKQIADNHSRIESIIIKLIGPLTKVFFPKIEKKIDDLREDLVEHFAKVFKLDKVLRYMELPNDADRKIERLEEQIKMMAKDVHPPAIDLEEWTEVKDIVKKIKNMKKFKIG